jgi:dihydropyrimidinase
MSTVIKGGTVVTADLSYEADVLVEKGVITEIGPNLTGDEVLDATGCYVMPGGIDPHVHLEMPFMGTYSSDDFESGTRAALAGGTTMVVDFCLPNQGEGLHDALKRWDNKSTRANCDYSFHMAVTWWGEQVFNDMKTVIQDRGITTFKHFLAYKGALMVNDDELFASFNRLSELGGIAMVHAENGDVVAEMTAKLLAEGNTGPEGHAYSRPSQVEGEATNRAIMIADMAGVPLYVVHVSCEEAHEAIRRARQLGKRVWGEPLIQHLTLDESEYFHDDWDHAARRVMSPPFRNKKHQESLWNGLMSGSLSVCATDHCAFTTEQKRTGIGDFSKIPNGTGGLEDRSADALDPRRSHGPPDPERVRRDHINEHRQDPELLSEKGCDPCGGRCRSGGLGPGEEQDDHRRRAAILHRLQRLRRQGGHRPAPLHAHPWASGRLRRRDPHPGRPRQIRRAGAQRHGEQGAFDLERADRTDAGGAYGHSGDRGMMS